LSFAQVYTPLTTNMFLCLPIFKFLEISLHMPVAEGHAYIRQTLHWVFTRCIATAYVYQSQKQDLLGAGGGI